MQRAAIGAGYAEATADHVRVITEYFQKREDIDVEQAPSKTSITPKRA